MRCSTVIAAALVAAATIVGASAGDAKPTTMVSVTAVDLGRVDILAPIEQCVRDNAAKVELAIPDLGQAVDFLVGKVCAETVAQFEQLNTKLQQASSTARWQKLCDEQKAARKNAPSGEGSSTRADFDFCQMEKIGFISEPYATGYTLYGPSNAPASVVTLASHLLLDLRLAHRKQQH